MPADKIERKRDVLLLVFICFLTLFFFIVDLGVELGIAVGVLYITVILLATNLPSSRYITLFAIISSILIVSKYFLYPAGDNMVKVVANRFISLYAIWATAIISLYRKESEMKLQSAVAELNAANRYLESFNHAVSHDLKNPLIIIEGLSNRLRKQYGNVLDDRAHKLIEGITSSCGKANQLIYDLLEFSRASSTGMNKQQIDMAFLARRTFAELMVNADKRNMELRIGAIPLAFGDQAMLRQVFQNLLMNAVKFTRTKKEAVIEIGGFSAKNENVYYVKDNGAGFDMGAAARLFHHFQRLHEPGQFEGTGLGLVIVKTIIEKHGGRVWAEGKVNEGAQFFFTLPRNGGEGPLAGDRRGADHQS